MTVRVDFVDCSCMRRAVRNGANEKNGKEQKPWHSKSSARPSDAWARVKGRLRAELGEDVFASWFRGVEVEQVDDEVVHLTVATRFLRNWLRSHYYDFVLRLVARRMAESRARRIQGKAAAFRYRGA